MATNSGEDYEICVICNDTIFDSSKKSEIKEEGLGTIIEYCEQRNHTDLGSRIKDKVNRNCVIYAHTRCRRNYAKPEPKRTINDNSIDRQDVIPSKRLRSQDEEFDWKTNCFFCVQPINKKQLKNYSKASFLDLKKKILKRCEKRDDGDCWASEEELRLNGCLDLTASDGFYHRKCQTRFMLNKTKSKSSDCNASGR